MTNYAGILFTIVATVFLPLAAIFERRANRKRTTAESERRYVDVRSEYLGIVALSHHRDSRDDR